MRGPWRLLLVVLAATACSRGDDTASTAVATTAARPVISEVISRDAPVTVLGGPPPTFAPVTVAPATAPPPTAAPAGLPGVCAGVPLAGAPAYDAAPGLHPVAVIAEDDAGPYLPDATELPAGWGGADDAELVACVHFARIMPAMDAGSNVTCPGYVDAVSGLEWSVNPHEATYTVIVRVAATAEVLGEHDVQRPAEPCPLLSTYVAGERPQVAQVPALTAAHLEPVVKPYVTGGASPDELLAVAPTIPPAELVAADFEQVCRGTGQASGAEYEAGPGIHPALAFGTTDGPLSPLSATLPQGWAAAAPGDTQLVVCALLVSATSNQVCGGYTDPTTAAELHVETFDSTYEVTVRVARTATVVFAQEVLAPGATCPTFMTFRPGDGPQPYFPELDPTTLATLAQPYVATP